VLCVTGVASGVSVLNSPEYLEEQFHEVRGSNLRVPAAEKGDAVPPLSGPSPISVPHCHIRSEET
jgi:hypothetical protein